MKASELTGWDGNTRTVIINTKGQGNQNLPTPNQPVETLLRQHVHDITGDFNGNIDILMGAWRKA